MKKILLILFTVFSFSVVFGQEVLPKPNPPRLVNDVAGVLSPEQREILEHKLVALDDSTSNQIAVVLIKTLGDYSIEDYATKLFRSWGIGNKKTNNGILIIAAIDDRKMKIEIGYGLEGAIPDVVASSIYRNELVPEFRQENYYRGLDKAINALTKAAVGEYKVKKERKGKGGGGGSSILGVIVIIFVIIIVIARAGRGGGGGMGGGRSGFGSIAEAVILSSLLSGGRGGGSGGGWGGGGGGGGGFGGFGGGSSGGGGAGGSW
jgi:uncharacterized protein